MPPLSVGDSSVVHAPVLAEARALLLRRDHAAARSLLKDLVRRDPSCREALQLLLSVDEAEQRHRMTMGGENEDNLLGTGILSRQAGRDVVNVLGGGLFLTIGLWYLFQFAHVGINGEFPMTNKVGQVRMMSGKKALLYGLAFSLPSAGWLVYGVRRFRLK